jgi:hypothetical protein
MLVLGEEDSELLVKLWAHAQEMWEGTLPSYGRYIPTSRTERARYSLEFESLALPIPRENLVAFFISRTVTFCHVLPI